jgi:hypothetical protein
MAQSSFLERDSPVDFLYLDKNRIASLIGQLSDKGMLTGLKSTVEQSRSTEGRAAGSLAIVEAEAGRSRTSSASSEESYDPFWTHAYTFLRDLEANFAVPLAKARLGSLVKFRALIQFLDLRLMRNLWEPSLRALAASQEQIVNPASSRQQKRHQQRQEAKQPAGAQPLPGDMAIGLQFLQAMPHLFHMTFLSEEGLSLWAAVRSDHLTISSEDLTMKFGAAIDGLWTVVGIVDGGVAPATLLPVGSEMLDTLVDTMAKLRGLMGRPQNHFGLTPIAIYAPLLGIAEIEAASAASPDSSAGNT